MVYCPDSINLRPFRQLKEEDILSEFKINHLGAVKVIRGTLNHLQQAEPTSSIVKFSTIAVQTGVAYHATVASTKGAGEGLTRSLTAELVPKIRLNCLPPSLTHTPLACRLLGNEEKQRAAAERQPLKRFGQPEDIANFACFLLGDESSWFTGQVPHVDGGMSGPQVF